MEYYELQADKKNYFIFEHRNILGTVPHFHGAIEIVFVSQGEQEVTVNGTHYNLKVGDGYISDSFSVHSYIENPESKSYVIVIDRHLFEKIIISFDNKIPPENFKFNDYTILDNLYKLCNSPYKSAKNRENTMIGAMNILFSIISEHNNFVSREKNNRNLLVKDILQYAENNLADNLSLTSLSEKFNYSKEHLSRILHKYLTENWATYLNRLRVEKAQLEIKENPNKSILDIAFSCGFESMATFYRAYKFAYGCNPRQEH